MRILVTGGAGFIGSHMSERLLKEGHSVVILDNLTTGRRENLEKSFTYGDRFTFVEGSVTDREIIDRMVSEADCVLHLAAAVGVRLIMEQPSQGILTNVAGTERVLEACVKHNTRIVIASTSEVYGKSRTFPQSESDDLIIGPPEKLRWSYACSKLLDEFLALAFHEECGLPATVLRFFNTTGPRQTSQYGMVIPGFVDAALEGRNLTVHGDGQQTRSFCHVLDVVEAVVRLLDTPESIGRVINVGNDKEITILELAQKVVEISGTSATVDLIPYDQIFGRGFEDMQRRRPDITTLKSLTGYRPETPLEKIIEDIVIERRSKA